MDGSLMVNHRGFLSALIYKRLLVLNVYWALTTSERRPMASVTQQNRDLALTGSPPLTFSALELSCFAHDLSGPRVKDYFPIDNRHYRLRLEYLRGCRRHKVRIENGQISSLTDLNAASIIFLKSAKSRPNREHF